MGAFNDLPPAHWAVSRDAEPMVQAFLMEFMPALSLYTVFAFNGLKTNHAVGGWGVAQLYGVELRGLARFYSGGLRFPGGI